MKVLMTIIYFILIGQSCFFVGLMLPRKNFDESVFPYKSFRWEQSGKVYDKLHIKKWKSKVPDMSILTNLLFPKRIHTNVTPEELDRLVKESCVAEMIHCVLCILSIGFYNIWKGKTGTILSILYFLGNPNLNKIRTYCRKQRKIKHCAAI